MFQRVNVPRVDVPVSGCLWEWMFMGMDVIGSGCS